MNKHFKSTFAHMFVAKKNNIVLSFVRYSSSKPKSTIDWERRACFFATKHVRVGRIDESERHDDRVQTQEYRGLWPGGRRRRRGNGRERGSQMREWKWECEMESKLRFHVPHSLSLSLRSLKTKVLLHVYMTHVHICSTCTRVLLWYNVVYTVCTPGYRSTIEKIENVAAQQHYSWADNGRQHGTRFQH